MAAAASPTKSVRVVVNVMSSTRAGMGQARWGDSGRGVGTEHRGDVGSGQQVRPQRLHVLHAADLAAVALDAEADVGAPFGSGNDQA